MKFYAMFLNPPCLNILKKRAKIYYKNYFKDCSLNWKFIVVVGPSGVVHVSRGDGFKSSNYGVYYFYSYTLCKLCSYALGFV